MLPLQHEGISPDIKAFFYVSPKARTPPNMPEIRYAVKVSQPLTHMSVDIR